nr:MAG TPA: Major head protein [Bacteriophage sp.]
MEKLLKLNIQQFADESGAGATTPESTQNATNNATNNANTTETPSFNDLLKNPDYQREFDKSVSKALSTARANWEKDYTAKLEAQKTEAEKLAQMDADQKIQYELEKAKSEKEALQSQLNAINLYKTASEIATEKELPIGYLDLVDFSKETAESITGKIDKIQELRQKDLQSYLNSKLKQQAHTEKQDNNTSVDPYIVGFMSDN